MKGISNIFTEKNKLKQQIKQLKNELDGLKPRVNAETTMVFALIHGNDFKNYLLPNVPLSFIYKDTFRIILHWDCSKVDIPDDGLPTTFVLDYSNDPTNERTGSLRSLGYYVLRFTFQNCKIINLNPLILEGNRDMLEIYCNRPQRQPYQNKESVGLPEFDHSLEYFYLKTYLLSSNNWDPVQIVTYLYKEDFDLLVVEELDLRSFYNKVVVLQAQMGTKEEIVDKFNQKVGDEIARFFSQVQ